MAAAAAATATGPPPTEKGLRRTLKATNGTNERTMYYDGGEKSLDEYSSPGRSINHYISRKYLSQCETLLLRSPTPGFPGPRWPRGVRLSRDNRE